MDLIDYVAVPVRLADLPAPHRDAGLIAAAAFDGRLRLMIDGDAGRQPFRRPIGNDYLTRAIARELHAGPIEDDAGEEHALWIEPTKIGREIAVSRMRAVVAVDALPILSRAEKLLMDRLELNDRPSGETLARHLECDLRHVRRLMKGLRAKGWTIKNERPRQGYQPATFTLPTVTSDVTQNVVSDG